ncbi:MAG: iron ABC transporter permease [Coriobacteriales bacterium]|jgi:iron complex transport system permease protein|nr:iron ABC transporter permease [Coriobacteriales bacterium]
MTKAPPLVKIGLALTLVVLFFLSFFLGRYSVDPITLLQGLFNHFFNPAAVASGSSGYALDHVIFNIRLPRILLVILVGAALASAGASLQGMFRNPLVSPDLLGASAGASLGACVSMLLGLPTWALPLCAFAGGLIAVAAAVWFGRMVRYDPTLSLVLGGILISTLFQAGVSLTKYLADPTDQLPNLTFWLMGGVSQVGQRDLVIAIIPLLLGFVVLFLQSWKLNVMSFGDEEAQAMGVNVRRTRVLVILASTLLASISVAVSGIIGWIGLVIPHFARAIVGPNYKALLPASLLIGGSFLLVVDDVARLVSAVEVPVGILTAIVGVPFFIVIFRRNMKGWS